MCREIYYKMPDENKLLTLYLLKLLNIGCKKNAFVIMMT